MELRCHSRILHGIVVDGALEVSCQSRWCGKRKDVTVIHRFDTNTGELLSTRKFKTPKEVNNNGTPRQGSSVRSA